MMEQDSGWNMEVETIAQSGNKTPVKKPIDKLKLEDISNNLLRGLAPPASPGPSGVKGEKILPGSKPWGNRPSPLSPLAKPFTLAAKRFNTTSAVELADREVEISDTDIQVGDDARHGINMEQIGDEMLDTLKEEDMMARPQCRVPWWRRKL